LLEVRNRVSQISDDGFKDRRFYLLDASVVAPYYLAACARNSRVPARIRMIVDAVRTRYLDCLLYIPNFCIAETFGVLAKYAYCWYDDRVRRSLKGKLLDKRVYDNLCRQFHEDIHNGNVFLQYELGRYHVLAYDLIAPVDYHYQVFRKREYRKTPMGTFDLLIISMGIILSKVHKRENTAILTADRRLALIAQRACRLRKETARKLRILRVAESLGLEFSPEIYPRVINLAGASNAQLKQEFGMWPLPQSEVPSIYRK